MRGSSSHFFSFLALCGLFLFSGSAEAVPPPSWQTDTRIGDGFWNEAGITADASGHVYAAWVQGNQQEVVFAERPVGGSWSTPGVISPSGLGAREADITVDPLGTVYVMYTAWNPGDNKSYVYVSKKPLGGSFAPPVAINDGPNAYDQHGARIVADANAIHAVFVDKRNNSQGVYYTRRNVTGTWSANVKVSDGNWAVQSDLAVDATGGVYVVWSDFPQLYFDYRPLGGSFGTDEQLSDVPPDSTGTKAAASPRISVNPTTGQPIVVWKDSRNGAEREVRSSLRLGPNIWQASLRVNDLTTNTAMRHPDVVFDLGGTAHAVWSDGEILSSRLVPGQGAWEADRVVSNRATDGSSSPFLAIDGTGTLHTLWLGHPDPNSGTYYAEGQGHQIRWQRGDGNNDGRVNIADISFIANYIFGVPPATPPPCEAAADTNGDGRVNIADPQFLANYVFGNPPATTPPAPSPPNCGAVDPAPLTCNQSACP